MGCNCNSRVADHIVRDLELAFEDPELEQTELEQELEEEVRGRRFPVRAPRFRQRPPLRRRPRPPRPRRPGFTTFVRPVAIYPDPALIEEPPPDDMDQTGDSDQDPSQQAAGPSDDTGSQDAIEELEAAIYELQHESLALSHETPPKKSSSDAQFVRWVQSALNQVMKLRLAVDGILGSQTKSAIRSFQQQKGLKVDGIVGEKTQAALVAAGAPPLGGTATGVQPTTVPPITIRVLPFLVFDRFEFNKSNLQSFHLDAITRIAHLVVAVRPICTIRIVGHTDASGSEKSNVQLGQRRAEAFRNQLELEIEALDPEVNSEIKIVVQSRGESAPVGDNRTPEGQAKNRRVEVFIPDTCHSFFAQYDMRFFPVPVFGVRSHPSMTDDEKNKRIDDVMTMVAELSRRFGERVEKARTNNILGPQPLASSSNLFNVAQRLSTAQIDLFKEYSPDGAGGIDFAHLQTCFEQFANGELRDARPDRPRPGIGEPDSSFLFLFAEFAFVCIESGIDEPIWRNALRSFVKGQEMFIYVYSPCPHRAPPPVPSPVPGGPLKPNLDDLGPINFNSVGQSNRERKAALRAKYDGMDVGALRTAEKENILRALRLPTCTTTPPPATSGTTRRRPVAARSVRR